jgi:hypothetical protein
MGTPVGAIGVVGITTTSSSNKRHMECVGTWSVLVGRRRVSRGGTMDW